MEYNFHLRGSKQPLIKNIKLGNSSNGTPWQANIVLFQGGVTNTNGWLQIGNTRFNFKNIPTIGYLGSAGPEGSGTWLDSITDYSGQLNTWLKKQKYYTDHIVNAINESLIGKDYWAVVNWFNPLQIDLTAKKTGTRWNQSITASNAFFNYDTIPGTNAAGYSFMNQDGFLGFEVWINDKRSNPFNQWGLEYNYNGYSLDLQTPFQMGKFTELQKAYDGRDTYFFRMDDLWDGWLKTGLPIWTILDDEPLPQLLFKDSGAILNYYARPYVVENLTTGSDTYYTKNYLNNSEIWGKDRLGVDMVTKPWYKQFILKTYKDINLDPYYKKFFFHFNTPLQAYFQEGYAKITLRYPYVPGTYLELQTTNFPLTLIDTPSLFQVQTNITDMGTDFCNHLATLSGGNLTAEVTEVRGYTEIDIKIRDNDPFGDANILAIETSGSCILKEWVLYTDEDLRYTIMDEGYEWMDEPIKFLTLKPRNSFYQFSNENLGYYSNDINSNFHKFSVISFLYKDFLYGGITETKLVALCKLYKDDGTVLEITKPILEGQVITDNYYEAYIDPITYPQLEYNNGLYHMSTYYKHFFPNDEGREFTIQLAYSYIQSSSEIIYPFTEEISYLLKTDINPQNTLNFIWINEIGGWDNTYATYSPQTNIAVNQSVLEQTNPVYLNNSTGMVNSNSEYLNGDLQVFQTNYSKTYVSRIVTNSLEEWEWINSLIISPQVYIWEGINRYKPIRIIKSNWVSNKDTSNNLLEIEWEYLVNETSLVNI